jgi:GT2 family glycosyltransferase
MASTTDGDATAEPTFSVIVPSHGRPAQLARCLAAASAIDYPANRFEVIVVDDGSPEPVEAVPGWSSHGPRLTIVRQSNGGPAAARNAGARAARGRFLAFTDDDCQPAPGWLTALATVFDRQPDALVGGRVINALGDNVYAEASQQLVDYLCGYYNADPENARFFTSNNIAVSKEAFLAAGGFDETFVLPAAEDRELCDRWHHRQGRLVYAPAAVVHHFHAMSLRSFARQQFTYGRGAFQFRRTRARLTSQPVRLEPASFYRDLFGFPSRAGHRRAAVITALFAIAQAANAAGFFWQAAAHRLSATDRIRGPLRHSHMKGLG